jgi:hypothetical protein
VFYADGQTDRPTDTTKLIVDFRNFANAPKYVKRRVFRLSQTFFTLKVPAILRVLLVDCKGSVTIEEDSQSKSAASHPVFNKFAKHCNTSTSLCHTHMELFMLDGLYAAHLSTCQKF